MCLPESDQQVLNEVSLERMKNQSACLPVERRVFGEVSAQTSQWDIIFNAD